MRVWPVLFVGNGGAFAAVTALVRRDALTAREDLDNGLRCPQLDSRADQCDRHAVEAVVECDVVVDVHLGARPHAELVASCGK